MHSVSACISDDRSIMTRFVYQIALATMLIGSPLLIGCEEAVLGPETDDTYAQNFDQLWQTFDRYYAAFVVKDVNWTELYDSYRPRLDSVSDEHAFFAVACEMLEHLEDGHVAIYAPFGTCFYQGTHPHNFNLSHVKDHYLSQGFNATGQNNMIYGLLPNDVGYVYISSFGGLGTDWSDAIDQVLEALRSVEALVIDVRDNGGGSSRLAEHIAGRFADEKRLFSYVEYRDGPRHTDFTEPSPKYVEPMGQAQFTRPVALLTNRSCFSACEDFTLAMGVLPHVVTVGDTTGGGFGNPLLRELPNGWTYRVPVWLQSTSERVYLEGIGIAPDVPVHITPGDASQGRDTILETAMSALREQRH